MLNAQGHNVAFGPIFRNLLMGEHNELKNCYLHVDYKKVKDNAVIEKSKNVTAKYHSKMSQQKSANARSRF